MVTKKYVKDYKFSETVTERGRIKTEAVYTGAYFRLKDASGAKRAVKPMLVLLCALWVLFVSSLVPNSKAAHILYVLLPYVFAALPLGRLTQSVLFVGRAGDKLIRSEADRISKQLPSAALWLMILSGVPAVGLAVTLLIKNTALGGADVLFLCSCAAMFVTGLAIFRRREVFSSEEAD